MKTQLKAAVMAVLVSGAAFADEAAPEMAPPVVAVSDVPSAAGVSTDYYFGISTGANLGLVQVDVQQDHFYAFASTTLGVPLLTNGAVAVGNLGLGYAFTLSESAGSKWVFDIYGNGMAGKMNVGFSGNGMSPYGAVGIGVGVRFLHRSGFMIGFKIPVFGVSFGDAANASGAFNGPQSLASYYLGYLSSSAPFTLGFRF